MSVSLNVSFLFQHVSNPAVAGDSVLAINKKGVHFLSSLTKV